MQFCDPSGHLDCEIGECPHYPGTETIQLPETGAPVGDRPLTPSTSNVMDWVISHDQQIMTNAQQFGVSPELVATLMTAEIDLDNPLMSTIGDDYTSYAFEAVSEYGPAAMVEMYWLSQVADPTSALGDYVGGYPQVKPDTYNVINQYMSDTHNQPSPGGDTKPEYLPWLLSDEGTIQFFAWASRFYADQLKDNPGTHFDDMDFNDMSHIWSAYRAGVKDLTCFGPDCWYTEDDFTDSSPGSEGRMVKPYWDYYQDYFHKRMQPYDPLNPHNH